MSAVEMGLLDAADVDVLCFEELLKFKFLLSHPFCIPVHGAKCLVTVSSTLSSPSLQKRIRAAVSSVGWALLRLRARCRPIPPAFRRGLEPQSVVLVGPL